jgi:hypothetical protein
MPARTSWQVLTDLSSDTTVSSQLHLVGYDVLKIQTLPRTPGQHWCSTLESEMSFFALCFLLLLHGD